MILLYISCDHITAVCKYTTATHSLRFPGFSDYVYLMKWLAWCNPVTRWPIISRMPENHIKKKKKKKTTSSFNSTFSDPLSLTHIKWGISSQVLLLKWRHKDKWVRISPITMWVTFQLSVLRGVLILSPIWFPDYILKAYLPVNRIKVGRTFFLSWLYVFWPTLCE